jgi:hypothetical protein
MDVLPSGVRIALKQLVPDPDGVLIEYGGPRFFVSRIDEFGIDGLVFCCDEDECTKRWILVPTSTTIIESLERGSMSVLDSLISTTSRPWILDTHGENVINAVALDGFSLIENYLPKRHLMLRADLQSPLTVRLEGPDLVRGCTPRDAVIHAFKNVPEGLKRLLDYVLKQEERTGRPQEPLRDLYGLSAQRFAFSSFEVDFRRPHSALRPDQEREKTLDELFSLVNKAILMAHGQDHSSSSEERRALLEAAYKLAPPSRGVVHNVSFSGATICADSNRPLTRASRSRLRQILAELDADEDSPFVDLVGRIGDVDFDLPSLELRDIGTSTGDLVVIGFEPEYLDEVVYLAAKGIRIRVFAERSRSGKLSLVAISVSSPSS